jgi:hypothetical protein
MNNIPRTTPTPTTTPEHVFTGTVDISSLFTSENLTSILNPLLNTNTTQQTRNRPQRTTTTTSNSTPGSTSNSASNISYTDQTTSRPNLSQRYYYNIPLNTNYTIPRIPLNMTTLYQTRLPAVERSMMNEMTGIYDDIYSTIRNLIRPDLEPVIVRPTSEQIDNATTLILVNKPHEESEGEGEEELCSICQDGYDDGQAMRKITHCSHSFHKSCIDEWFEQNVHCPICRFDIRDHTSE